jgi:23S rRNA G2445 N2-methylase RlmL
MAGGGTIAIEAAGLAVGAAIRRPAELPFRHLAAFDGLPTSTPNLFPGTVPQILALDLDEERIATMVGNLRAAGLTGRSHEASIVIGQKDMRSLTPEYIASMLPGSADMKPGVFCFNPPYGVRIGGERGEEPLLDLYTGMGRALARFRGWRAACFVANARFVEAFGHVPTMTKPATNAELPGAFLVYEL